MRKLTVALIFVSLLFAAACGGPANQDEKKDEKKDTKKEAAEKPGKTDDKSSKDDKSPDDEKSKDKKDKKKKETDAVPVQVVNPQYGDISAFLLFSSNVDAEKIVDVYPMTGGIIEKIIRDEGDHVKKGDTLAVLDDREAVINEKRSHINYQQLQAEFERQKEIYEKQMISKEEHERLRYRMQTAKLDWEQAKLMLSYTRITSPISGVVTKRHIKQGNKINISQLSFSVVQIREKIAVVNIPGQEKEHIFRKQKCFVISGAKQVNGHIKRISPAIDPESGTFKVTVEVSDPKDTLAVGQFVNVKIIKKVHKNVILLSKEALIYDGGKVFVFIVDGDKKAQKKRIELGFDEGGNVEVTKGLTDKEQVVTAGKSSLKDDTLVKIVEPVI